MANFPIKLQLDTRPDRFGKKYYIAKVEAPISIHCEKGVTFMVFTSEQGAEELHICPDDSAQKKSPQVYRFTREATEIPEVVEDLDKNGRK